MKSLTLLLFMFTSISSLTAERSISQDSLSLTLKSQTLVFMGHTAGYFLTQSETIRKEGSAENYKKNFLQFRFDNDNTNWNYIGHSLTGSQVYLFYRSQKYSKLDSFYLSFLSSLWFEVFIENYTEKPSLQDIFNTPIFGSALGFAFEDVSYYLIKSESKFSNFLGRLINPFSLLSDDENISFHPVIGQEDYALNIRFSYE